MWFQGVFKEKVGRKGKKQPRKGIGRPLAWNDPEKIDEIRASQFEFEVQDGGFTARGADTENMKEVTDEVAKQVFCAGRTQECVIEIWGRIGAEMTDFSYGVKMAQTCKE